MAKIDPALLIAGMTEEERNVEMNDKFQVGMIIVVEETDEMMIAERLKAKEEMTTITEGGQGQDPDPQLEIDLALALILENVILPPDMDNPDEDHDLHLFRHLGLIQKIPGIVDIERRRRNERKRNLAVD